MRDDDRPGDAATSPVVSGAGRPRLWPLLAGLTLVAAIGVAGCGFIWGGLPEISLSRAVQDSAGQRERQQARAELSAQDWSGLLREGLDCAGAMAARLALDSSGAAGTPSLTLRPAASLSQACPTKPKLLLQVWLLQAAGVDQASPQPVLIDGRGDLGALSSVAQRRLRLAADSQWDSYALTPGQTQGLDQFVPVRGLARDAVLLMRYGAGPGAARLIDERSADHGVPIRSAPGLRVAIDDTEAERRVLATATWLLVVAGLAALLVGRYRQKVHKLALDQQIEASKAAKLAADMAREIAETASRQALTAEGEAREFSKLLNAEIEFRRDIEESSPVGLRVIDNEGRLIDVNSAFCASSGWTQEELLGKLPPYPYWPSREIEDRQSQLEAIFNGSVDAEGYRVTFVRPGGNEPWLSHVRANRLRSGNGWILSSVDITEDRTRQEQIENLTQELARQADFFILGEKSLQLAHDLTSHVVAIDQNASNLEPWILPLGGTAQIELSSIQKQAKLMGVQLDEFAGDINGELRYERFKIDAAVDDAILLESERARAMNARISNLVYADMPAQLLARAQLTHVLRNLVANGLKAMHQIKFPNRHIVVNSRVESDPTTPTHPNGRQWLHLTVEDRGCGIPDRMLRTLFDQPQARTDGGRGLGLWLCRRWIERMGGRLTVRHTSEVRPTGTVMLIVLPYQQEKEDE